MRLDLDYGKLARATFGPLILMAVRKEDHIAAAVYDTRLGRNVHEQREGTLADAKQTTEHCARQVLREDAPEGDPVWEEYDA